MEAMFADLWNAVKQAGPFASLLLLYLWNSEKQDRLKLQNERDALLERVLKGMNDATISIRDIAHLLHSGARDARED